jgi:hypothetical protein
MTIPPPKRNMSRPGGYADVTTPITEASAHAEPPEARVMAPRPVGTLSTTIDYRGRSLTISASGMTLDAFYDAIDDDKAGQLFTIACRVAYREQVFAIEFSHMTIDGFCDMLDKRLGRAA